MHRITVSVRTGTGAVTLSARTNSVCNTLPGYEPRIISAQCGIGNQKTEFAYYHQLFSLSAFTQSTSVRLDS